MIRKDVYRLAERLHEESGIHTDFVYYWLMDVGREKGINPTKLTFRTATNRITLDSENYLTIFDPLTEAIEEDPDLADYWEGRILARQEID